MYFVGTYYPGKKYINFMKVFLGSHVFIVITGNVITSNAKNSV